MKFVQIIALVTLINVFNLLNSTFHKTLIINNLRLNRNI